MPEKDFVVPESNTEHKKLGFWGVYDKIINFAAYLSCVSLLVISFVIVADVFMRYVFNRPFAITEPLGELIMVLLLAFGGTYLLREQDFIRVDILVQFLPAKAQMLLRGISDIIAGIVFCLVGCGAFLKNIELIQTKAIIINSGGNWLHAVYMTPLVLFIFLACIQFLRNALHTFSEVKQHRLKKITLEGEFMEDEAEFLQEEDHV